MSTVQAIRAFLDKGLWDTNLKSRRKPTLFLIRALRLLVLLIREATREELSMRAMGLVYVTLLSLVPFLAVSFSVVKALGFHVKIQIFVYYFLEPLGDKGVDLSMKVIEFVEKVNAGVLGSIGLVILVYTVISQVQKIERAFNAIWNVKGTRKLMQRISNYLSVMFMGPVLAAVGIGTAASFAGTGFIDKLRSIEPFGSALLVGSRLLPYILISSVFSFIYKFLPNTTVYFKPALAGGFFAGIAWVTAGWVFTSFVMSSAQYSAIYSGFAILIISLIWLYWSFLILLVGARVSFFMQYPHLIAVKTEDFCLRGRHKERLALLTMHLIGENFVNGKQPWTVHSLEKRIGFPAGILHGIITVLERKGLIASTTGTPPAYLPARDIDGITLKEILDAVKEDDEDLQPFEGTYLSSPEVDKIIKGVDEIEAKYLDSMTMERFLKKEAP